MTKELVEPKLISQEDMDAIAGSLDALRALGVRKPKSAQQVHMENRLADFLELAEQDFLKGWTDCEEGIRRKQDSRRRTTLAMLTATSTKQGGASHDRGDRADSRQAVQDGRVSCKRV